MHAPIFYEVGDFSLTF